MDATTAGSSAVGSALVYLLMKMFRKWKNRKQKILGLYLVKGKQYCQEHLTDKDHIFVNMDKLVLDKYDKSISHLYKIPLNDRRIKVYPIAHEIKRQLKLTHMRKTLVLCSSDPEMLDYLGIKTTHVIPNNEFMIKLKDVLGDSFDKVCLVMEHVKAKDKNVYQINSFLQQSEKIVEHLL